jgi:hypothetical protein
VAGGKDRAAVPDRARGLSGRAYLADDWSSGGVSAFKAQAEPAVGDAALDDKLPAAGRIAIRSDLKGPESIGLRLLAFREGHGDNTGLDCAGDVCLLERNNYHRIGLVQQSAFQSELGE